MVIDIGNFFLRFIAHSLNRKVLPSCQALANYCLSLRLIVGLVRLFAQIASSLLVTLVSHI